MRHGTESNPPQAFRTSHKTCGKLPEFVRVRVFTLFPLLQPAGAAMRILRDRVRRLALVRYFADLPPVDRATFWVGIGLAFALAFSIERIIHAPAADVLAPFDIDATPMRGRS